MTYRVKAYAKVNLHLEVLNRRSDSYHNIFSLNASLKIYDRLTFKRLNIFNNTYKDLEIDIHPAGGEYADIIPSIATEDNLISKAVKLYFNRVGKSGEISISVEKNIPFGAGLAGGSSDAAAALRFLNNYFNKSNQGLQDNELLSLAVKLGADVSYCLTGGFALCEGIGDIIENIRGKLKYWILIANCGIMVNTAKAYDSLKRHSESVITDPKIYEIQGKKRLFREGLKEGKLDVFKHILKNDFEETVFNQYPELKTIKDDIAGFNAEYAAMTGSGSSIIGIFKSKRDAEKAGERLSKKSRIFITEFY